MKKIILTSIVFLFFGLGLTPHVLVAAEPPPALSPAESGFVPLAPIPGLTSITDPGSAARSTNLADFFNSLYKYLIGLAATLAIIQIIWGGVNIATNQDDVSKIMDDKGKIYNAIFGLVLVLSPVLVFSIINPNILNLSLNLPPIDTTIAPTPTPVGNTPVTTETMAGVLQFDSQLIPCDGTSCSDAKWKCDKKNFPATPGVRYANAVVCVKDRSVDPNGLKTSFLGLGSDSCIAGETLQVKCTKL